MTTTNSTKRTPVEISFPAIAEPHLRIVAGACRLRIRPGPAEPWIQGTFDDPTDGNASLRITENDRGTHITVDTGAAQLFGLLEGVPELELALGTARPFALTIEAGASDNAFEFGGVPLTSATITHGAAKATLSFSANNPVAMGLLKLGVGAGAVEARGLANAGCAEIDVDGGAAGVQLHLDGTPVRDCRVRIATALAGVELFVPADLAAEIRSSSILGGVDADAGFARRGDTYCTPGALRGATPVFRIHHSAALGGLRLRLT
jgi:hypothetical protein